MCKGLVTAVLVLTLSPSAASAQNLLTNPGFATDLGGWLVDGSQPETYSADWNSLDATGNPGSGSARVTNEYPEEGVAAGPIAQCVPVIAGAGYALSVQMYVPPGQSRSGYGQVLVYWYTGASCDRGASLAAAHNVLPVGVWTTAGGSLTAPANAHSLRLDLRAYKSEAGGTFRIHADNASIQRTSLPVCIPSATALCIDRTPGDRRFRAFVIYATEQSGGLAGEGHAVDLDTLGIHQGGVFWFFDAGNPELLLKVLDGCGVNGKYWVFFSAGTNVGFTVEVLDTVTGEVFRSSNPDLTPAPPVQATTALPCPSSYLRSAREDPPSALDLHWSVAAETRPAAPREPAPLAACAPSAATLCIDKAPGDRRFSATVTYQTEQGGGLAGAGHAVDLDVLGIHQGGVFWFFDAGNPELLLKVLDGCALGGHYWVFFSAGTNVGFTLEVVDTVTGEVFESANPDLHPAAPVQATAALPCS